MTSLFISGLDIEGQPCEGYGFKVLNCENFSLKPEEQRDINIAFTPDFTLSSISRRLSITTSLSPNKILNFTMEATVPSALIAQCAASLPRPSWETYLYHGANWFMVILVFCVLIAAYFESDRILKCTQMMPILHRAPVDDKVSPPDGVPFDLRGIPQQVNNELRNRNPVSNASIQQQQQHRGKTVEVPRETLLRRPVRIGSQTPNQLSVLEKTFSYPLFLLKPVLSFCWSRLQNLWRVTSSQQTIHVDPPPGESQSAPSGQSGQHKSSKPSVEVKNTPVNQGRKNKRNQNNSKSAAQKRQSAGKTFSFHQDDEMETCSSTTESSNLEEDLSVLAHKDRSSGNHQENDLNTTFEGKAHSSIAQHQSLAAGGKKKNKNNSKASHNQKAKEEKVNVKSSSNVEEDGSKKQKEKSKSSNSNTNASTGEKQDKKGAKTGETSNVKKQDPVQLPKKQQHNEKLQAKVKPSSLTHNQQQTSVSNESSKPPAKSSQTATGKGNPQSDVWDQTVSAQSRPNPMLKQKAKVTPVGKILPEPKKPENHGAQFGPVGTKPYVPPRQSTWTNSPAEATPPIPGTGLFGQLAHPEKSVNNASHATDFGMNHGSPLHRSNSTPYQQHQQQQAMVGEMNAAKSNVNAQPNSPARTTLMQSLQMERRQRTEEYLRQRTDWPGFNDQKRSYLEDLWDPSPTMPQHSTAPGLNQYNNQQAWGGNTLEDVWPTASFFPTQQSPFGVQQQQQQQQHQQQQQLQPTQLHLSGLNTAASEDLSSQGLGFNPMQLSSIWNSPTMKASEEMKPKQEAAKGNSNNSSPWNGSLFNNWIIIPVEGSEMPSVT